MTHPSNPAADPPGGDGTAGQDQPAPGAQSWSGPPPPPPPHFAEPVPPPPGYPSVDDKAWALVAHFGGALGMFLLSGVGGWITPLIALLVRGNQSPTIRAHAINALNFQLLWSIVGLIGWITVCLVVGVVIIPLAAIVGIVVGIIAGVKANNGELYRYPASINLIK